MGRTIVNPEAGSQYFTTAGVAINSTNQPDVNGGAMAGVVSNFSNELGLLGVTPGDPVSVNTLIVQTSGSDGAVIPIDSSRAFPYLTQGTYIIYGSTTAVGGVANTVLRNPASDDGNRRAIHKVESVRTTRVTKAIRDGYWNEVSGVYTTAPETSSDLSTMGQDQSANVDGYTKQGMYAFQIGKLVPSTGEYEVKT